MTEFKKAILVDTLDYLKKIVPNFVTEKAGKSKSIFTCPLCRNKLPSCSFKPFSDFLMYCTACKKSFNAIDVWKELNPAQKLSEEEILVDIQRTLGSSSILSPTQIKILLKRYQELDFDLLPISAGSKIPLEQEWQNKIHKEISEWENWIFQYGFNIGVKTGKCSNCIVVDFDDKIPKEIKDCLGDTLIQKTPRGLHYFYQYDEELTNANNIGNLKIDVRSDNGQIIIVPSITDGKSREFLDVSKPILKISEKLKKYLLERYSTTEIINEDDKIKADIEKEDFNLGLLGDGDGRNNALIRIGGILRKKISVNDVNTTLYTLNKVLFSPPLNYKEMRAMFNSLEKYSGTDETKFAKEVYERLKISQESSLYDLLEMFELDRKSSSDREKMDVALKFLIKEGLLYKSHRMYHIVETPNWQTEFMDEGEEIKFKFPYLSDVAVIRDRDICIFGASTGAGKTHLAMNMIKRLKEENIVPDYYSSEGGSRFATISKYLGLVEGDYRFCKELNPMKIKLSKNAVTVVDWLRPHEYSETDTIFEKLNEEIQKQGGVLIVFMQLRKSSEEFFAKDLVEFYPALVAKFLQREGTAGVDSYFETIKIREVKVRGASQNQVINCRFDFDTKELKTLNELEAEGKL